MAAYPSTLPVCVGTKVKRDGDIEIDRASNGSARGRSLYTADKRTFTLKHGGLSSAQRATLDAFYDTNKTLEIDFTFDGATYTCIFADAPQTDYTGANYADVTVELIEV